MLKKNNDPDLVSSKVDTVYVPLCQIWQELVHNRTLDVYQYRILNSLSALMELDEVISKTIEGLYLTSHNIESCKEETLYILNSDDILEKYEKPLLNRLRAHLGKKTGTIPEQKVLRYQIKYAINELSPKYLNLLFDELKADIDNRNIELIVKHSNSIVSQCINNGWSAKALFDVLRHFKTADISDNKWSSFKNNLAENINITHDILVGFGLTPQNWTISLNCSYYRSISKNRRFVIDMEPLWV